MEKSYKLYISQSKVHLVLEGARHSECVYICVCNQVIQTPANTETRTTELIAKGHRRFHTKQQE
jgi:pyruvate dehydrogenase complex dehydrogenase (E1) component